MDTHITAHHTVEPDQAALDAPLSARLPGEPYGPPLHDAAPGDPVASDAPEPAPQPLPPEPRKRRGHLLLGTALTVLAAGGAVAFAVSPYNTLYPLPGLSAQVHQLLASAGTMETKVGEEVRTAAAAAGLTRPKPLAPSAALASVQLPPLPPAAVREKYVPSPRDQQIRDLLALHPAAVSAAAAAKPATTARDTSSPLGAPIPSAPLKTEVPLPAPVEPALPPDGPATEMAMEPGSVVPRAGAPRPAATPVRTAAAGLLPQPAAAPPDVTRQVLASAVPLPLPVPPPPVVEPTWTGAGDFYHKLAELNGATPPSPVAPAAAPPSPVPQQVGAGATPSPVQPADVVAQAEAVRPGPLTPQDQVQVLNMVAEMAHMVHDLKAQDAQLRADLRKASASATARLDDFDRRLSMSEARRAMSAAAAAGEAMPSAAEPPAPAVVHPIAARPAPFTVTPSLPGSAGSPVSRRYRVQAASPGLALLAEVDRGGGEGAQLQVAVGDTLPDLGRVKSIAQRGTAWVVTAEHGSVQ
jgi:hypothetical protein